MQHPRHIWESFSQPGIMMFSHSPGLDLLSSRLQKRSFTAPGWKRASLRVPGKKVLIWYHLPSEFRLLSPFYAAIVKSDRSGTLRYPEVVYRSLKLLLHTRSDIRKQSGWDCQNKWKKLFIWRQNLNHQGLISRSFSILPSLLIWCIFQIGLVNIYLEFRCICCPISEDNIPAADFIIIKNDLLPHFLFLPQRDITESAYCPPVERMQQW